jgi:hypothetical protein
MMSLTEGRGHEGVVTLEYIELCPCDERTVLAVAGHLVLKNSEKSVPQDIYSVRSPAADF